jgi:hypothetical protein
VTRPWRILPSGLGLANVVTWVALGVAAGSLGCQTHQCDPDFACIDGSGLMKFVSQASDCTPETQGDTPIAGYNTTVSVSGGTVTWDTSPLSGPWLNYPGNRTYILNFPEALSQALAGGTSQANVSACISADNPGDAGVPHMNFICGAGYVAEFSNVTSNQLTVLNASCAGYSLRIEVQAQLASDAGTVGDAGTGTDGDAGVDAEDAAADGSPAE